MAGVTFLAFGNGSPDVFSTFAAMNSHSGSLAIGELIGAAGFITAVVAGSMALVREFRVGKKTFVRDVGFFIVAASFSMLFLADGALHWWECSVMIGFYLFYVGTVVVWHWYLSRRRRRRERDAAARGHYLTMTNEEVEVTEEDGDDEDAPTGQRRYRDAEDFGALEHGVSPGFDSQADDESDEDGEQGMHLAAEMASSMRVLRPSGPRRNTITPIRPSLVGALEFRSILSTLQKSRGSHARPIHLRRYSDEPINRNDGTGSEPEPYSDNASSIIGTPENDDSGPPKAGPSVRTRAVSMNDAAGSTTMNPAAFTVADVPNIGIVAATPTFPHGLMPQAGSGPSVNSHSTPGPVPPSPTFSLTPPASHAGGSRDPSPAPSQERQNRNTLAPPEEGFPGAKYIREDFFKDPRQATDSPHDSPRTRQRPRLQIPGPSSRDSSHSRSLSPAIQFPLYTDSPLPMSSRSSKPPSLPSLILPDAHSSPESIYTDHELGFQQKPIAWWPQYLPGPYTLASVLFPTLCTWRDKSIWDKIVSVISAPSIFLLAITLPVVESGSQSEDADEERRLLEERSASLARRRSRTGPTLVSDSPTDEVEPEWIRYRRATESHDHLSQQTPTRGFSGHSTAEVVVSAEQHHQHPAPTPAKRRSTETPVEPEMEVTATSPRDWNRWLVVVQIFTAPLFVVLIVWANTAEATNRRLVQMTLWSLLGSLVAFAVLIVTTTNSKPPKYRFLLCFLGFVVSIAWISTIANEVVGVLKAFGVILGISDAILGLTIFAVGNSLGDLVADVTVARLGYPVMALSACFGGPMLNILLGIGVSGLYMTMKEANHKHEKHPGKKIKYKPYEIEVSGTLMVSAVTLLVTLIGLLIAVPMNKWVMSRKIGWGLIILWSISTVVNLAVEISGGFGDDLSAFYT
jgi:sodium/potassium/calcium exchanger 6